MGPLKKYITLIMVFFILFNCVTFNQFYTIMSPVIFPWLLAKSNKVWNERKKHFLYIWPPNINVSHYIKEDRRSNL